VRHGAINNRRVGGVCGTPSAPIRSACSSSQLRPLPRRIAPVMPSFPHQLYFSLTVQAFVSSSLSLCMHRMHSFVAMPSALPLDPFPISSTSASDRTTAPSLPHILYICIGAHLSPQRGEVVVRADPVGELYCPIPCSC
jgi:hypothetical protein